MLIQLVGKRCRRVLIAKGTGAFHHCFEPSFLQMEHPERCQKLSDLEVLLERIFAKECRRTRPTRGIPDPVTLAHQLAGHLEPLVLANDCKICESRTLRTFLRGFIYERVLLPWSLGSAWSESLQSIAAKRFIHVTPSRAWLFNCAASS